MNHHQLIYQIHVIPTYYEYYVHLISHNNMYPNHLIYFHLYGKQFYLGLM
nr:MAG TPA: hypothetical protein [Caudoviricetes sp.]